MKVKHVTGINCDLVTDDEEEDDCCGDLPGGGAVGPRRCGCVPHHAGTSAGEVVIQLIQEHTAVETQDNGRAHQSLSVEKELRKQRN